MEEDDKCPICLNLLTESDVYKTHCGHSFHTGCIAQIRKEKCPMCRANLALAEVIKNDNDVVNEIRHDSEEEREEERRLIHLALEIINRDNTVTHKELTGMLIAAKGRPDFLIDDLLSMFDDDRPATRIRALSPAASPVARHVASPVASFQPIYPPVANNNARSVTKPKAHKRYSNPKRVPKRDPKHAWNAATRFKNKSGINKSGGKKLKKKGQRTHRKKKNTSRSLYTIE